MYYYDDIGNDSENYIERLFGDFDKTYRKRSIAWLSKTFGLQDADCEDVIQDAYVTLYDNVKAGKFDERRSSLYTYFLGVCKNEVHELIRRKARLQYQLVDDNIESLEVGVIERNADRILELTQHQEQDFRELVIEQVVKSLPSPCGELLWSFYRDALPMKTIAVMFGYASENSAKVTKHRCQERFRKYYEKAFDY